MMFPLKGTPTLRGNIVQNALNILKGRYFAEKSILLTPNILFLAPKEGPRDRFELPAVAILIGARSSLGL